MTKRTGRPNRGARKARDTEAGRHRRLIPSNRNLHFAALLNERQEDLAFFDQRIEKGLLAKLEGIVGSEFVHMDYGEAIQVLERANEKFEFPVKWGIDLLSP
jgi:aspartyl/asparaginyl-tRNA synthetase